MTDDDLFRLMNRVNDLDERVESLNVERPGSTRQRVMQVFNAGAMPSIVPAFYATHPVTLTGTEAEGNPFVVTVDTSRSVPVVVLDTVPAVGDNLFCRQINGLWIARKGDGFGYTGPPGIGIPGCVCVSIPPSVALSSSGPCGGLVQACNLVWGPTPPDLSTLNLGANCYLSDQTFFDSFSGLYYRYNFACDTIYFRLSRVYLPGPSNIAYHDASIYSWSVGQPGNACNPFLLSNGLIYSGGNVGCIVTVSG